jgi:hypothetical protein
MWLEMDKLRELGRHRLRGIIQEAPQAQKMLKNKSSHNLMKPVPLRLSRHVDSGSIFTFSNRLRMRDLSHSNHFLKQGKSQRSTVKSQR